MTMQQMADGLTILVDRLANDPDEAPDDYAPHEWSYIKGIASAQVMALRDHLQAAIDRKPALRATADE